MLTTVVTLREHEILELEVSVDDRLGGLVGDDQCLAHLERDVDRPLGAEGAVAVQDLGEVAPLDELHEEVDEAGLDVLLVRGEAHDVRRLRPQPLHDLGFAQETRLGRLAIDAGEAIDAQDLEGFDPAALHVLDLVDRPEGTGADPLQNTPFTPEQRADERILRIRRVLLCFVSVWDVLGIPSDGRREFGFVVRVLRILQGRRS